MLVVKRRTLPLLISAVKVAKGPVWFEVEPKTVINASVVLSVEGPCVTKHSTISNLLFVASDIEIRYFALLMDVEEKLSTTLVVDVATVTVPSDCAE